jgi:hypothetical protein
MFIPVKLKTGKNLFINNAKGAKGARDARDASKSIYFDSFFNVCCKKARLFCLSFNKSNI